MPVIRDGRNQVDEYRTEPPPAVPSGPVIRDRVSEARMADFAAERARAAAVRSNGHAPKRSEEGSVPPRGHHDAGTNRIRQQVEEGRATAAAGPTTHWAAKRAQKLPRVVEAVQATATIAEAAERLGITKDSLKGLIAQFRADGTLPPDVDELIRARSTGGRPRRTTPDAEAAAPVDTPSESSTPVVPAEPVKDEPAQEAANFIPAPMHIEAPEAVAPATADVDLGTTAPPAAEGVATPPEPAETTLSLTLDVAAVARVMDGWYDHKVTAFFDGLAKLAAALR